MTRTLIWVGSVFALVIAALLLVPSFIDWNNWKDRIEAEVQKASGYTVKLDGDLSVAILPTIAASAQSVKVYTKEGSEPFLSLGEAKVGLKLLPLLSGKVDVSSLSFDKPVLNLQIDQNGTNNWTATAPQKEEQAQEQGEAPAVGKSPDIRLNKVTIKGGEIHYQDGKTNESITAMNTVIRADSLMGPFAVKGDMTRAKVTYGLDVKAGKFDLGKPLSLDAKVSGQGGLFDLAYKGTVTAGDVILAKGDVSAAVGNIDKLMRSFNPSSAANAALAIPVKVSGALLYDSASASLSDLDVVLNKSIKVSGKASIEGLGSNKAPYARFDLASSTLPGSASLKAAGSGQLDGDIKATIALNAPAIRETVKALLGQDLLASAPVKSVSFNGDVISSNGAVSIHKMTAKVDDTSINGSLAYTPRKTRALLALNVSADKVNLDKFSGGKKQSSAPSAPATAKSIKAQTSGISLPFDLDAKVKIGSVVGQGQSLSNVVANGTWTGDTLSLSQISAKGAHDTSVSLNGGIANVKALSGLNLKYGVSTGDVHKLAAMFGQKVPDLPVPVKSLSANGAVKGSLDAMNFDASVKALSMTLSAAGKITDPMGTTNLSGLSFSVAHPNTETFIRMFDKAFKGGKGLRSSMKISSSVSSAGKKYTLSNLKLKLGSFNASGKMTANLGGSKPDVTGSLSAGAIDLNSLLGNTSGGGSSSSAPKGTSARWSSAPINTSFLHTANLNLNLKASSLTRRNWVLSKPSMTISLQNGVAKVQNLKAGVAGGSLAVNGTVRDTKGGVDTALDAKITTANLRKVLQSGASAAVAKAADGIVSVSVDIKAVGRSTAALVNNLNGAINMSGSKVTVNGLDLDSLSDGLIAAKGGKAMALTALTKTLEGGKTSFNDFKATIGLKNGIGIIQPFTMATRTAGLATQGVVNFPKWTLDVSSIATLKQPENVPPYKMRFTGSLDNPKKVAAKGFINDYASQFLKKKVEDTIIRKLKKEGVFDKIAPILGGDKNAPANDNTGGSNSNQIKPEDVVKDVLKGLF